MVAILLIPSTVMRLVLGGANAGHGWDALFPTGVQCLHAGKRNIGGTIGRRARAAKDSTDVKRAVIVMQETLSGYTVRKRDRIADAVTKFLRYVSAEHGIQIRFKRRAVGECKLSSVGVAKMNEVILVGADHGEP